MILPVSISSVLMEPYCVSSVIKAYPAVPRELFMRMSLS